MSDRELTAPPQLRLYSFVMGLYLSPIQHGIQTAHLVHDLMIKYLDGGPDSIRGREDALAYQLVRDWARNYKTIIVLSAVNADGVKDTYSLFQDHLDGVYNQLGVNLPFARFREDEASLGGLMTCCGVVLPDFIYDAVDYKTAMNTISDPHRFTETYDLNTRVSSYFYVVNGEVIRHYPPKTPAAWLIERIKSCKLA